MTAAYEDESSLDDDGSGPEAPETGDGVVDAAVRRLAETPPGATGPVADDAGVDGGLTADLGDDPALARALDDALEAGEALHRTLVARLADLGS